MATPTSTPSPFPSPRLSTFQSRYLFGEFVYRNGKLIYGGAKSRGMPTPDVVEHDISTGDEKIIASTTSPDGSVIGLTTSDDWLMFLEVYNEGPLIYRLRALGKGQDIILTEANLPDPDDQLRQRQQLLPMVALAGSIAVWTEAPGPQNGSTHRLRAMDLASGRRADLYSSQEALTFPAISAGEVIFGEGAGAERRLLAMRPFRDSTPVLVSNELDLSEPAYHDGLIVAKKGGGNAIDPHGIVWVDRATGKTTEIMPPDEAAWSPTFNERFVVWQGGRTQQGTVRTFDRTANAVVDIYSVTKTPKPPIASRPVAFPGALVWLSLRAEDADKLSTAIPQFNVLELR